MNDFKAETRIDEAGILTGKIYDRSLTEEYTNFRINSLKGEFVSSIRNDYIELLCNIKQNCFEDIL